MMLKRLDRDAIALVALIGVALGIWGAWIPNIAASLSQNVFYLAEWSTFLPGVRSGQIRLAPDTLRLSAALGVIALLFAAQNLRAAWARWLLRAAAAVPVLFVLLPPYPDVFQMWGSPSYGARFGVSSLLVAGLVASALAGRIPASTNRLMIVVSCILAAAAAIVGLSSLIPPFQADYAAPLGAGWGGVLFFAGLILAAASQALPESVFRHAPEKQNGPVI
jgi:hypothetical protein